MLLWCSAKPVFARLIALGSCAALLSAGVMALTREAQAARFLQAGSAQRVLAMRQYEPGWQAASTSGLKHLMRACADMLLAEEMVRLSPRLRDDIAGSCSLAADAVLQVNPSFSRALAVGLVVAEPPILAAAYAKAQAAARFEPWPLQIRVLAADRLARNQGSDLSADLIAILSQDLRHLMQLDWGQDLLRQLYAQNSPLRPLIQDLLRQQPHPSMGGENG